MLNRSCMSGGFVVASKLPHESGLGVLIANIFLAADAASRDGGWPAPNLQYDTTICHHSCSQASVEMFSK